MKKQAFNPYLPSYEYIPDGEPRIFGNRVYIYGSHDQFTEQKELEAVIDFISSKDSVDKNRISLSVNTLSGVVSE